MKSFLSKTYPLIIILLVAFFYFLPIWKDHLIPFPGHLLVSFFSPWKEESWSGYPAGVPRQDLLGFDTVRMMGPWRHFAVNELKSGRLPIWNPYQFTGAPLLANSQSAIFFPFNWLYLIGNFNLIWTILVILQPIMAAGFMYVFLKKNNHLFISSVFASLAYGFSAWMSSWIEWNIHGFVYALLPLALFLVQQKKFWLTILIMSLIILAGHPQMAVIALTAIFIFSLVNKNMKWLIKTLFVSLLVTSIQWYPTLRYFKEASRETTSSEFSYSRTLLPWKQLPQFLAPTIFGHPATGNYSGQVNFVESTAYTGVALIGFAMIGARGIRRKTRRQLRSLGGQEEDKEGITIEAFAISLIGLIALLTLPTPISFLIGKLNIPILGTSVASRWLMLFPLAISLAGSSGIDYFIKINKKNYIFLFVILGVIFFSFWIWSLAGHQTQHLVARRNLIIPTGIVFLLMGTFWITNLTGTALGYPKAVLKTITLGLIGVVSIFELILFGWKTMTYTEKEFIYPETPILSKLKELSSDYSRFASTSGSSMESNFATYYGLYDIAGYDALYPRNIGELVWAAEKDGKVINDFSRSTVVTPTKPSLARDNLWNLTGIRWIIHKDDLLPQHPDQITGLLASDKFQLIWERDKWQIYENKMVFPRAFFMNDSSFIDSGDNIIERSLSEALSHLQIIPAKIISYRSNKIDIEINSPKDGWLILTDTFYPGWQATVDNQKTAIIPAFHAFRAVPVTTGQHIIKFKYNLL